jgi:hypothetical protein
VFVPAGTIEVSFYFDANGESSEQAKLETNCMVTQEHFHRDAMMVARDEVPGKREKEPPPSRQTSELVRQDFLADVINKIGRELSRGF